MESVKKSTPFSNLKEEYGTKKIILMMLLIFVIGGIFGFIYEELFYRIDLGYFVKRGTTLGPWIPIYGFGSLFITALTYNFKDKPWLVFIGGAVVSGVLEYVTGYCCLKYSNLRLWDYNVEIWNWGNINGFICIRSVLFFAVSSLLLLYVIIPFVKYLEAKLPKQVFSVVSIATSALFFADFFAANVIDLY